MKLQIWFLHQNRVKFHQKSKFDVYKLLGGMWQYQRYQQQCLRWLLPWDHLLRIVANCAMIWRVRSHVQDSTLQGYQYLLTFSIIHWKIIIWKENNILRISLSSKCHKFLLFYFEPFSKCATDQNDANFPGYTKNVRFWSSFWLGSHNCQLGK